MKQVKTNKVAVPPNSPWVPLAIREESGGYLNYFYNDDLSGLTVRAVTKVKDNKADPNLETKTYGLFSPCNKPMRKGVVRHGCRYIFFFTNRKKVRVLAGLYLIKWYAPISSDDFCLAADSIWFIEKPIPLVEVDENCGTRVSRKFRNYVHIDADECKKIEKLLKRRPNVTSLYLSEIDRLERFNLKHGGYRYVTAKERDSYSWHCDTLKFVLKKAIRQK